MGRLGLAFSAFFRVLGNKEYASVVAEIDPKAPKKLAAPAKPAPAAAAPVPAPAPKPTRSEALTLLSSLQREGRFIDFVMEDLSSFSDAQVGAAARDVHRGAASVLKRMFEIKSLRTETEGESITVEKGFDPQQVQLVGKVAGEPPFKGSLVHPGWKATKVELPTWTGSDASKLVVSAAEVELS